MKFHEDIFKYKVAVGLVFKKLRITIIINGKPMTQQYLNNDIYEKYGKSWNCAREETFPNTTLENIYLICNYFNIEIDYFFQLVKNVPADDIDIAIKNKYRLSKLYKSL